tara:strand:- start:830 stop:1267 length:438 start_codon:yes stop_codon:yes gene_type:complete
MMSIELKGIDDVKKLLEDVAPKRATNLITATVRGVANEIKKEISGNLPKKTGGLKRSLKVKKARSDKFKPIFRVVFTGGKSEKNQGSHWIFLEHGTSRGQRALHFVRKSRLKIESNLDFYITNQFVKKMNSAMKRETKRQAAMNK